MFCVNSDRDILNDFSVIFDIRIYFNLCFIYFECGLGVDLYDLLCKG